jgi:phosphoglycolate phosphatase-like HAD superfamily hydrolase
MPAPENAWKEHHAMKLFVWDMHGTLETGNDHLVIDISNRVLMSFGYAERFSYQDGQHLNGRKWHEYFTWLLGDSNHQRDILLQEACIRLLDVNPGIYDGKIQPTPHASHVLDTIRARHEQILISNSRQETLRTFIKVLGYERFFSSANAFAVNDSSGSARRSKEGALADYLRRGIRYEEIVLVGDSPGDMNLERVAGGTTCLFAHPGTEFKNCRADYRIRDLRQVLSVRQGSAQVNARRPCPPARPHCDS